MARSFTLSGGALGARPGHICDIPPTMASGLGKGAFSLCCHKLICFFFSGPFLYLLPSFQGIHSLLSWDCASPLAGLAPVSSFPWNRVPQPSFMGLCHDPHQFPKHNLHQVLPQTGSLPISPDSMPPITECHRVLLPGDLGNHLAKTPACRPSCVLGNNEIPRPSLKSSPSNSTDRS